MIFKDADTLFKEDARRLYIRFPRKIKNVEEVRALHPQLTIVRMPRQSSARFCFAEFDDDQTALDVKSALGKMVIDGKKLFVNSSVQKKPQLTTKKSGSVDPFKLYIGGIPPTATKEELEKLFPDAKYLSVPKTKKGKTRHYAFVGYESEEQVQMALARSENLRLKGKTLVLNHANIKKEPRDDKKRLKTKKQQGEPNVKEEGSGEVKITPQKRKGSGTGEPEAKKQKITNRDTKVIKEDSLIKKEDVVVKEEVEENNGTEEVVKPVANLNEGSFDESDDDKFPEVSKLLSPKIHQNSDDDDDDDDEDDDGNDEEVEEDSEEELIPVRNLLTPSKRKDEETDEEDDDVDSDEDDIEMEEESEEELIPARKHLTPSKQKDEEDDDVDKTSSDTDDDIGGGSDEDNEEDEKEVAIQALKEGPKVPVKTVNISTTGQKARTSLKKPVHQKTRKGRQNKKKSRR